MKKTMVILAYVLLLAASACTIDLQAAPAATTVTAPTSAKGANPTSLAAAALASRKIPVTWSALKLAGQLIFIRANQTTSNPTLSIQSLDLSTGEMKTLFQAPDLGWIYSAVAAPGGSDLIITYTPPPQPNAPQPQRLYRMPLDGSQPPAPLFAAGDPADQYFQPEWAPDGKTLYFVQVNYQKQPKDQHYATFQLYRMAYPNGEPELVAENGSWPRLSTDGTRLAYVTTDPISGWNTLVLANPDGKEAQPLTFLGGPTQGIIDAPLFLPDGKFLLFSAPGGASYQAPSWVDRLLGVEPVQAHTVPSEWWRVPVAGGAPVQITHLQAPGLYACLSPDGRWIASFSGSGIFVMQSDGTALTTIYNDLGGIYGTVSWMP